MKQKEDIIAYLKDKPLYIEVLRAMVDLINDDKEVTPSSLKIEMKRSMSTISKPLKDIERDLKIIKHKPSGRKRIFSLAIEKRKLEDILTAGPLFGYLLDGLHRTGKLYASFYKECAKTIETALKNYNLKVEREFKFDIPFLKGLKDEFDFLVTTQKNKRIAIELEFLTRYSKTYIWESIKEVISLNIYKRDDIDGILLVLLLPSGYFKKGFNKWKFFSFIDNLINENIHIKAIVEGFDIKEMKKDDEDLLIKSLVNEMYDKIKLF